MPIQKITLVIMMGLNKLIQVDKTIFYDCHFKYFFIKKSNHINFILYTNNTKDEKKEEKKKEKENERRNMVTMKFSSDGNITKKQGDNFWECM